MRGQLRSTADLRTARRELFDRFPHEPNAASVLEYQERLTEEILRTEAEKAYAKSSVDLSEHLQHIRIYGDALAHRVLSRYAIRQVGRNAGRPPALTGQGSAFSLVVESARSLSTKGVPVLIADLTHSIRNGDLLLCGDPDLPIIIECKTGQPKKPEFERQGRRGRQLARIKSIHKFLLEGSGQIFGETLERRTLSLTHAPEYSWSALDDVTRLALSHTPVAINPAPGELLTAALTGEVADTTAELSTLGLRQGDHALVGNTLEALSWGVSDVPPPILWKVNLEARWALMEGDLTVSHAIRLEALLGCVQEAVRILRVIDVAGQIPWAYEVAVGGEVVTISANAARDVVYCHETMVSARRSLAEIAQGMLAQHDGPA